MKMTKQIAMKRSGTSFHGYLYVRYDQLISNFGEYYITDSIDTKTDIEWIIDTPHGVATIYNYKSGKRYLGADGLGIDKIDEWHVGGRNDATYKWVKAKIFGVVELLI